MSAAIGNISDCPRYSNYSHSYWTISSKYNMNVRNYN